MGIIDILNIMYCMEIILLPNILEIKKPGFRIPFVFTSMCKIFMKKLIGYIAKIWKISLALNFCF